MNNLQKSSFASVLKKLMKYLALFFVSMLILYISIRRVEIFSTRTDLSKINIKKLKRKDLLRHILLNRKDIRLAKKSFLVDQTFLRNLIKEDYRSIAYLPLEYKVSEKNWELFINKSRGKINHASESMRSSTIFFELAKVKQNKENIKEEKNNIKLIKYNRDQRNKTRVKEIINDFSEFKKMLSHNPKDLGILPKVYFDKQIFKKIVAKDKEYLLYLPETVLSSHIYIDFIFENNILIKHSPTTLVQKHYKDLNKIKVIQEIKSLQLFKKNKEVFFEKFKKTGFWHVTKLLKTIPLAIYQDKEFLKRLLHIKPSSFFRLPEGVNVSKEILLDVITKHKEFTGRPLKFKKYLHDNKITTSLISNDPYFYRYLPKDIKIKREVAKAAIISLPQDYKLLPKKLKEDLYYIRLCLSNWKLIQTNRGYDSNMKSFLIEVFDRTILENDYKLIENILDVDPASIHKLPRYINKKLLSQAKDYYKLGRANLIKNILSKKDFLISEHIKIYSDDYEIAKLLVENHKIISNFKYLSSELRDNIEIVRAATLTAYENFKFAGPRSRSNKDLILSVIPNRPNLIKYVSNQEVFNEKSFVLKLLKRYSSKFIKIGNINRFIGKKLKNELGVIKIALKADPSYINYIENEEVLKELGQEYIQELKLKATENFIKDISGMKKFSNNFITSIPSYVSQDITTISTILEEAPYLFKNINDKLKNEIEVINSSLKGWEVYQDALISYLGRISFSNPSKIKSNNTLNDLSLFPLNHYPTKFNSDKTIVLRALKISPLSYSQISFKLLKDKEVQEYSSRYIMYNRKYPWILKGIEQN